MFGFSSGQFYNWVQPDLGRQDADPPRQSPSDQVVSGLGRVLLGPEDRDTLFAGLLLIVFQPGPRLRRHIVLQEQPQTEIETVGVGLLAVLADQRGRIGAPAEAAVFR